MEASRSLCRLYRDLHLNFNWIFGSFSFVILIVGFLPLPPGVRLSVSLRPLPIRSTRYPWMFPFNLGMWWVKVDGSLLQGWQWFASNVTFLIPDCKFPEWYCRWKINVLYDSRNRPLLWKNWNVTNCCVVEQHDSLFHYSLFTTFVLEPLPAL